MLKSMVILKYLEIKDMFYSILEKIFFFNLDWK